MSYAVRGSVRSRLAFFSAALLWAGSASADPLRTWGGVEGIAPIEDPPPAPAVTEPPPVAPAPVPEADSPVAPAGVIVEPALYLVNVRSSSYRVHVGTPPSILEPPTLEEYG